jgi:hypothetical protein
MVQKIEVEGLGRYTNVERGFETSKKVANVIQYLITNENMIMVTQDAKFKNDRFLSLHNNADLNMMNLQGSNEEVN